MKGIFLTGMKSMRRLGIGACKHAPYVMVTLLLLAASALAADDAKDATKYGLRYKFRPGETLRWSVFQQKWIQFTYGGATKKTESADRSTKCWRVIEVDPDGNVVFEQLYSDIHFRGTLPGQEEVRYNSKTDKKPPAGLEGIAKQIGVPLFRIKMDSRGRVIERKPLLPEPAAPEKPKITILLPKEPVAVGESWHEPDEIRIPLTNGTTKTIQVQRALTLVSVKTGVATIKVADQVLTPIHSPEIEGKLIGHYAHGTVRFDVDAGRILHQQMDLDHQVVGSHGPESALHHVTRSTEQLVPEKPAETEPSADTKAPSSNDKPPVAK